MGRLWNMSGAQTHGKVTTPLGRTLAYLLAAQRETVSPFLPRSSNRSLGGGGVWTGDLGNRTVQKDGLQVELRLERNSCPGTRCYPWTKKPDFSPMSAPA